MANIYESMNVLQKLSKARLQFLNQKVTKSGKNMHLEFKYFELEDIVPPAIRIFARVGLVTSTAFDGEKAIMTIFNADNPAEAGVQFIVPYREVKPIVSNQGKEVTNPMQALGSSITYLRRYLWMMALDITEPDDIDGNLGSEPVNSEDDFTEVAAAPVKETPKAPATPKERKAAKNELTNADGEASAVQVDALKTLCRALIDKDESQEDFIQQIALKTNGFTSIKASVCNELCENLRNIIAEYGAKTDDVE